MGSRLENNSKAVRKRIESHTFDNEDGEEYSGSAFGGFSDYFRRKKIKLQNLDSELRNRSIDKPPLFRGVVVHVNGYTQPSLNDLHHLIVSHGGGFMQYLDGKTTVTHIICSNLTPKKAVEFRKYRIVKPAWIVESVKSGKLLPWDTFRVVDEGHSQKILVLDEGKVSASVNSKARSYRDQTDSSWYTSQLIPENELVNLRAGDSHPSPIFSDCLGQPAVCFEEGEENDRSNSCDDSEDDVQYDDTILKEKEPEAENIGEREMLKASGWTSSSKKIQFHNLTDREVRYPGKDSEMKSRTPDYRHLATDEDCLDKHEDKIEGEVVETANMTAEEHNIALLSDPQIRKLSTLNPGFLEQYYRESRLHHLSTWKADLKSKLQALTAEKSASQKARQTSTTTGRRYILHVDFDSFFVAISLKKHPQYLGKPVAVAHGSGGGSEIASCNYPARKYGVKNGMWMKRALELCPDIKVLPYDFPEYEEASKSFYEAAISTGGVVQSVSIDEALIDVTSLCLEAGRTDGSKLIHDVIFREQAKADDIAQIVRDKVEARTGCKVSIGIGGNILLAKCALRRAKPAGQYQVKPEEVLEFLAPLEVQALPGVAWSIGGRLEELGIKLVRDIRNTSKERLVSNLGPKTGQKLWNYSRGIDRTEVGEQVIRKSVSAEVNWGVRFETQEQAEEFVESLCGELNKRLLKEQVRGRQMTMKIMKRAADAPLDPPKHLGHGRCDTFNKSVILGIATNTKETLSKEAIAILRSYGFPPGELRGLGVQMQKLEPLKGNDGRPSKSNQMRLQFKSESNKMQVEQESTDPIEDVINTPEKRKCSPGRGATTSAISSRKPLNTAGTQFLLPTQADQEVLAELPQDIRDRLTRQIHGSADDRITDSHLELKSLSSDFILPNESQLDPEILEALPDDVRAEINAHYRTSPRKRYGQSVLPQSPRKVRSFQNSKKPLASKGRSRANFLSRLRGNGRDDNATLTQANFITTTRPRSRHSSHDLTSDPESLVKGTDSLSKELEPNVDVSPDFLAALPTDIRYEVLEQRRRDRLNRTVGLDLVHQSNSRRRRPHYASDTSTTQRLLKLAARPPKPTFTTQKLSAMTDLREAISAWFQEFKDEGPYQEDVHALVTYLKLVILEERDMSKAVKAAKWMGWVLEQGSVGGLSSKTLMHQEKVRSEWLSAMETVKDGMRAALKDRGLGSVDI